MTTASQAGLTAGSAYPTPRPTPGALSADVGAALRRLGALLRVWHRRAHSRRQLARMDDRALWDIGLSRADAFREARKWFWQA